MQRYFVAPEQLVQNTATITGDDAHHISRVMRAREGEAILVANGVDRTVEAVITSLEKDRVTATVIRELGMDSEPRVQVWLAQSLPKGDKLEMVIQKCTEIGATRIIPFLSERTVVQYDTKKEAKRLERWRKIAKEAAEQAHRCTIPDVDAPLSFREILKLSQTADLRLFCYEKEAGTQLREVLSSWINELPSDADGKTVVVMVGPEGGFSEREASDAEENGFQPVGLGSRILRTETAGMVALTCILYETGEMGGS
jgi:16S rRNA (uracil1498-N3)-methyltransferase